MAYLMDTHSVTRNFLTTRNLPDDIYIIRDVEDELLVVESRRDWLASSKVNVLDLQADHYEKLKFVLDRYGDEIGLIDLSQNKGKADVLMLAFILTERERTDTLFRTQFILITKDESLISAARSFGIETQESIGS